MSDLELTWKYPLSEFCTEQADRCQLEVMRLCARLKRGGTMLDYEILSDHENFCPENSF